MRARIGSVLRDRWLWSAAVPLGLVALVVGGMLAGWGRSTIAVRTYEGPPEGVVMTPADWSKDSGGSVAVIEAPDRLDIAVWMNPRCHGIPEALTVVNRHAVAVLFHFDGIKGCKADPYYSRGLSPSPLTSVLRLDPKKIDTTTDLRVFLHFAGVAGGTDCDTCGIVATPRSKL